MQRIHGGDNATTGLRTQEEVEQLLAMLRADCLEAIAKGETVVLE